MTECSGAGTTVAEFSVSPTALINKNRQIHSFKLTGTSNSRRSIMRMLNSSRVPVELGAAGSLMALHTWKFEVLDVEGTP
ncbi:hypothetical protein AKJ16_DCAP25507, partial [Drosera capensis]